MGNIVRVEQILSDTFLNIERVQGQDPIWFGYGDTKELDSILDQKKAEKKYPLLWYMMPNRLKQLQGRATGKCTFILAHNTTLSWNNDQRFAKVYDAILFPYLDNILKTIDRSANLDFSSETGYYATNFPNYGVDNATKTAQIGFWDAIKIEFEDLTVYNDYEC